jgi:hypothetical protein
VPATWGTISRADVDVANEQLRTRREELARRHAEELKGLEQDKAELQASTDQCKMHLSDPKQTWAPTLLKAYLSHNGSAEIEASWTWNRWWPDPQYETKRRSSDPWRCELSVSGYWEELLFFKSRPEPYGRNLWADFQAAATFFELHIGFTRVDVEGTFRRLARKMHPDAGGTHETFQKLVSQRDLLLSQAADVHSETIPPRDLADAHL